MTNWPKNDKHMSFSKLTDPVYRAIRRAYTLTPNDYGESIKWTGPELPESMRATCFSYAEKLTREQLEYDEQDQGRDPLEVIVGIAVQLGIEQGRRLAKEDLETPLELLDMAVSMLNTSVKRLKRK